MDIDTRANFLAICLLESLEDEDIGTFKKLLVQYNADPNQIVLERGITPFHYACGMDNLELAENLIEIIINNGGNPNVPSTDDVTPLHIAAIFGRTKIVRMLLENGGDIHSMDNRKYTPLQYAVYECHFDVIETIRNYVFEQKIEQKKQQLENTNELFSPQNSSKPIKNHLLSVQKLDDKKYTPNRINYNFDVTSPYYINITHRRKPPLSSLLPPDTPPIENNNINPTDNLGENLKKYFTSTPHDDSNNDDRTNLFELTEENLSELSKNISPEHSRVSLIKSWRDRVQRSKNRKSILGRFNDIDTLLSGIMNSDTLDFTNTILKFDDDINDEESPEPEKSFSSTAFGKLVEQLRKSSSSQSDGSFLTAEELANQSKLSESNFIRSPKQTVYQMAEQYEHIDHDQGLVFFEEKLIMNIPQGNLNAFQIQKQKELNQSQSSLSTDFTVPLDYDTEALRAELTQFGEPPGPITKSTKRLYTKRLIKYKKNPEKMESLRTNDNQNLIFSIELQRTVKNVEWFQRIATEYLCLEQEMCEKFKNNHKLPDKKWREGNLKQSFIYLLIDPRMSNNLPCKSVFMNKHDIWTRFLSSIFYVGKGKSIRPFSHLYDALKIHSKTRELPSTQLHNSKIASKSPRKIGQESNKIERILDIWKDEYGVICLHVFHNILPAEAYTREAAIIDALGLQHLTNLKRGDYYGSAQSWTMRTRKFLGIALLFKSLQIYLAEGESQLYPSDLI